MTGLVLNQTGFLGMTGCTTMKPKPNLLILLTVAVCVLGDAGDAGNVLVWPTEGSHWINLRPVLETLNDKGHNVTVLFPSASLFMDITESASFRLLRFNMSISKKDAEDLLEDFLQFAMYDMHGMSMLQRNQKFAELFSRKQDILLAYCDGILKSPSVMDKLRQEKFHVFLVDTFYPCGELLAEVLTVPFVTLHRFSWGHTLERMCGQTPAPPSYVPGTLSKMTDRMSFTERVFSLLFYLTQDAQAVSQWTKYDTYFTEYLGKLDSQPCTLNRMRLKLPLLSLLSGALVLLGHVDSGRVLVWPAEGSHWINLIPVLDNLMDRGHDVTVLVPNATLYMDASKPERYSFLHFNASISMEDFELFLEEFLEFEMYESHHMNVLQKHVRLYQLLAKDQAFFLRYCDGVLKSPEVMDKLREAKFDLILSDPLYPCAELAAEVLGVPLIFTFRFSFGHTVERMCAQIPAPPSYVPGAVSELTDKMSFFERVVSVLFYVTQDAMAVSLWKMYDDYYTEYLGPDIPLFLHSSRLKAGCKEKGKGHIYHRTNSASTFHPQRNPIKSKPALTSRPLIRMEPSMFLLPLISVVSSAFGTVACGNVLVWPTEGSHWINLKPVLETLTDRRHEVTVLVPSATLFMDASEAARFTFLTFTVSISTEDLDVFIQEILQFEMYEARDMNILKKHARFYELFSREQDFLLRYCDGVLKSPELMDKLRGGRFDMILVDPIYACAELLAEVLGVPFIYTYRYSNAHTMERLCGQTPAPPSYAPGHSAN
ncbi:hypothetical protein NFI96_025748 [Prochilodus magdalenae]|nr:hypothetical protein NFI96_025748 [Prochilodus magdalenae]